MSMEMQELARRLLAMPTFSRLSVDSVLALLQRGGLARRSAGEWVTGRSDVQRDHLVLLAGEVQAHRAWIDDMGQPQAGSWLVGVTPDGPGFGLVMASAGGLRVQAHSDIAFVAIDADRFDALQGWADTAGQGAFPRVGGALDRIPLENAQRVRERMVAFAAAAGDTIVTQGDPGDAYYVLLDGAAEVWVLDPISDELLRANVLGPGDAFGEEALLLEGSRTATVRMLSPGRLLRLTKVDFDELLKAPLVEEVDAVGARRLLHLGEACLIDCRYAFEFDEGHIPGAQLLPLDRLRQHGVYSLDPATAYVVYCRSGRRSKAAAFLLRERGIRAWSMSGGIRDWPFELSPAACP